MQLKAEIAQAQIFVIKFTLPIYCKCFMSILFIDSDFFNIFNISQSILREVEIQQISKFQNYLDILPDTLQSYLFMLIIMKSNIFTSLIPTVLPRYSTSKPPIPELLTLYTLYKYLTSKILIYKRLFSFQLTSKSVFLRYSTSELLISEPLTLYSSTPKLLIPYFLILELLLQKPLLSYSFTPKPFTSKLLTP